MKEHAEEIRERNMMSKVLCTQRKNHGRMWVVLQFVHPHVHRKSDERNTAIKYTLMIEMKGNNTMMTEMRKRDITTGKEAKEITKVSETRGFDLSQ